MKCEHCHKNYPDKFVQPLTGSDGVHIVDPECALQLMSEIHGIKFTKFNGEMAQQLLEDFRKFKHKQSGFTLMEAIISILITIFFILIIITGIFAVKSCIKISDIIEEDGLKTTIDKIWEGTENNNNNKKEK